MAIETEDRHYVAVLPCLVLTTGAAMLLAAAFAALTEEIPAAVAFGSWAAVIIAGGGLCSFVFQEPRREAAEKRRLRSDIGLLLFLWLGLPALSALPVHAIVPEFTYADAYFEMVSGFTTTGATLLQDPSSHPRSLLVWRSTTQWLGGLGTLTAILAVLAPHALGAYSLEGIVPSPSGRHRLSGNPPAGATMRWMRAAVRVVPLYTALTIVLLIGYFVAGMSAFDAFNHALTTISTGGFSTRADSLSEFASWQVEAIAATGMVLGAIGIGTYARLWRRRWRRAARDSELQLFLLLLLAASLSGFARHFLGEPLSHWEIRTVVLAETLWSETFAVISALTTTGFPSAYSGAGAEWSGLGPAPALFLGLAIAGGSAASTAGGVRLMSVSLLVRHSLDEFGRIGRPRYVRGNSQIRDASGQLQIAWIGSMLFALAASAGVLAVSTTGMDFEISLSAVVTSLTNAGPLLGSLTGDPNAWGGISPEGRTICALFMALGRVGVVSVVAILFFD